MAARSRKWAEARSASRSEMRGPSARDEVATGGQGHLERAHIMGLIIDPVVILLGAVGG